MIHKFKSLECLINKAQVESLESLLENFEAQAITLLKHDEKILTADKENPYPLSQIVRLNALFFDDADQTLITEAVKKAYPELVNLHWETITDTDWQSHFKQTFQPFTVLDKLCITPSWETVQTNLPTLTLDPGLAFGTGTHPTTRMCLEALIQIIKPRDTIIDYGCGSGILGLSAIKLGAEHVTAIDIESEALDKTAHNARLNHIDDTKLSISKDHQNIQAANIVIANILSNTLIELKSRLIELTQPAGHLILSGLLPTQVEPLLKHFEGALSVSNHLQIEGWSCICLKN